MIKPLEADSIWSWIVGNYCYYGGLGIIFLIILLAGLGILKLYGVI